MIYNFLIHIKFVQENNARFILINKEIISFWGISVKIMKQQLVWRKIRSIPVLKTCWFKLDNMIMLYLWFKNLRILKKIIIMPI